MYKTQFWFLELLYYLFKGNICSYFHEHVTRTIMIRHEPFLHIDTMSAFLQDTILCFQKSLITRFESKIL